MDCSVQRPKEHKNKKAREVATSPLPPTYTPKAACIYQFWHVGSCAGHTRTV